MSMKPVKHFVKAVVIDNKGIPLKTQIMTPAMEHDGACDYLNWLHSTISGSAMKFIVGKAMTDILDQLDSEWHSILFIKFETTLY